ncbi:MAG: enhanced serine sensitivity protein SseB C-terminal domain-containing protein [Candidatus Omnitrophota bacterium]
MKHLRKRLCFFILLSALISYSFAYGRVSSIKINEQAYEVIYGEEMTIYLGKPANPPTQLIAKLKEYFKTNKKIESAYLAQMAVPQEKQPSHPVIGIKMSGQIETILDTLFSLAKGSLRKTDFVDFIPIEPGTTISEYMLKEVEPFYEK